MWSNPIHRDRKAGDGDALHLLFLFQTWRPLGYYENESDFALTTARDRVSTYQWGHYTIEHHHCAICVCGTWSRSPVWDSARKQAVPGKFKLQINAWLLEDFDPDAQPVKIVDGKNLW